MVLHENDRSPWDIGVSAVAGAAEMDDLRELYTGGLSYEVGEGFVGGEPSKWKERQLSDPLDCLRLKLRYARIRRPLRPSTLSVNASLSQQLRWKPSCKSSR